MVEVAIREGQLKCLRCGHRWNPRTNDVRICPCCKSPYWDKPAKNKKRIK